jgi:hypothetical protein
MWDRALRETDFTGVNFEIGDYKEPGSCLHRGSEDGLDPSSTLGASETIAYCTRRHYRHSVMHGPREDWPASGRHKPFSVSLPTHLGRNLAFHTFQLGQDPYRFKRNHRSPVSYSIIGQPPYARTKSMPHASDLLRHRREIQPSGIHTSKRGLASVFHRRTEAA